MFIQQRRRDRLSTSHADRDPSVDHPEMDDDKAVIKMQKEQRKRSEKENREKRNRDQDDRDIDHDNNRDLKFADRKKSVRKVEGVGGNSNFASHDDKDALKSESIVL